MHIVTAPPPAMMAGEAYIGVIYNSRDSYHLFLSAERMVAASWHAAMARFADDTPSRQELLAIAAKTKLRLQYWSSEEAVTSLFDGAWYYDFGTQEFSYCQKDLRLSALRVRRKPI